MPTSKNLLLKCRCCFPKKKERRKERQKERKKKENLQGFFFFFNKNKLTFSTPRNTESTKENQNSSHKPYSLHLKNWKVSLLFSEGGGFLCVSRALGISCLGSPAAFLCLDHLWINKGFCVSWGSHPHFLLTESGHLFLVSGRVEP